MKIKKILSILMIATFTSAMPVSVEAVPPKSGNSQKSEQTNDVMPFMNEYAAAKLAINDVSKNLQPRTNIHPSSKKYYDAAYQRAKKEKLNRQGFDDAVEARPQAKFEDKQHSDWYNEGYAKGKIMHITLGLMMDHREALIKGIFSQAIRRPCKTMTEAECAESTYLLQKIVKRK